MKLSILPCLRVPGHKSIKLSCSILGSRKNISSGLNQQQFSNMVDIQENQWEIFKLASISQKSIIDYTLSIDNSSPVR